MTDGLAAEWVKLRSVRSTWYALYAAAGAVGLGAVVAWLMIREYNAAPPAERADWIAGDPMFIVLPLAGFCLAALGTLAVTAEYATGAIRTSLVAVPRRGAFLAAKTLVVATVLLVAGMAAAFSTLFSSRAILGDWLTQGEPVTDGALRALAQGLVIAVTGLIGLGLGTALRSSMGAMVGVGALLFVVPIVPQFLDEPWRARIDAVQLANLPEQLSGTADAAVLAPWGAALVLAAYLVFPLAAGALALTRRDA